MFIAKAKKSLVQTKLCIFVYWFRPNQYFLIPRLSLAEEKSLQKLSCQGSPYEAGGSWENGKKDSGLPFRREEDAFWIVRKTK